MEYEEWVVAGKCWWLVGIYSGYKGLLKCLCWVGKGEDRGKVIVRVISEKIFKSI